MLLYKITHGMFCLKRLSCCTDAWVIYTPSTAKLLLEGWSAYVQKQCSLVNDSDICRSI